MACQLMIMRPDHGTNHRERVCLTTVQNQPQVILGNHGVEELSLRPIVRLDIERFRKSAASLAWQVHLDHVYRLPYGSDTEAIRG